MSVSRTLLPSDMTRSTRMARSTDEVPPPRAGVTTDLSDGGWVTEISFSETLNCDFQPTARRKHCQSKSQKFH